MATIAAIHTVVNSGRIRDRRFGVGILRSLPFAGFMPYTQQDLDDAAAMFADSPEPDWDMLAREAESQDRYESMAPTIFGHCQLCGEVNSDLNDNGLCDRCDVIACEKSTTQRPY
jgi:hypothetical protein